MIALLEMPLALLGLTALPTLAAIYLLRSRWRRQEVSSLMLWGQFFRAKGGGRKIDKIQTPLLALLELLALALASIAAAGPMIHRPSAHRPLAIVLDDSFSMLAGGADSARSRAISAIEKQLQSGMHLPVHLVLAGPRPRVLDRGLSSPSQCISALNNWRCQSDANDIQRSVVLAQSLAGSEGCVLVVTDQPPAENAAAGNVRWLSVGRKMPNAGFVNAAMSDSAGDSTVLLEVANFAEQPRNVNVRLQNAHVDGGGEFAMTIGASQAASFMAKTLDASAAVKAEIDDDALTIDNSVTLLPQTRQPLRVKVAVSEPNLQAAVTKAVEATGLAKTVASQEELLVSDAAGPVQAGGPEAWQFQLIREQETACYAGPFVVDAMHPLARGLNLQGVVWAAGAGPLAGRAVVLAGDVPLLSEMSLLDNRRIIRMKLNPSLSTLQEWPDWPALWWNTMRWRQSMRSGPDRVNARLGQTVRFSLPTAGQRQATVSLPDGTKRQLSSAEGVIAFEPELAGLHCFTTESAEHRVMVNAMNRDESDLSRCQGGQWGSWLEPRIVQMDYAPLAWIAALLALAALVLHMRLLSRHSGMD